MNTPAKKLLAMLEDEVESLPVGEVREDLASLGIDPTGAVAPPIYQSTAIPTLM